MSDKPENPEFDPFAPWIELTDKWVKSWAGVMSDIVASEGFAKSMGQQMEGMLEATKLIQQQMRVATQQYLRQMNLPTRDQIVELAERLTSIEMRLDDLEAKVDKSQDWLQDIQKALSVDE